MTYPLRPLVILLVLLGVQGAGVQASAETPDYAKDRAEQAKELTKPYGWFSLIALAWLKPGTSTVGSAKGNSIVIADAPAHLMTLEQKDEKVMLVASDPSLTMDGKPVAHALVNENESEEAALVSGTLRIWAIQRGDRRYLRVKDSNAPARKNFHGLSWYAPAKQYRIPARWMPYSASHTLKVTNKLGQVSAVPVPGYVEFEVNGAKQTLVPMSASKDGLFFVFRDLTAKTTTDGGGRFLSTSAPSNGLNRPGTVVLDFNQAVNPPCAYSPYATCPLASPENRLTVSVPAGEERYE